LVNAQNLGEKLRGKILLQVEDQGRIWYVNPQDNQKYEVNFENSLDLFRKFATGITKMDLEKIPLILESKSLEFGKKLQGRFFLDVEDGGRIWYVDFNGFRHEIKRENLLKDLITIIQN
jgi:hypothetical protein